MLAGSFLTAMTSVTARGSHVYGVTSRMSRNVCQISHQTLGREYQKQQTRSLSFQKGPQYDIWFPTTPYEDAAAERTPVVFLFGWAGSKRKHLAKYAAIYQAKGFITIPYTAPMWYVYVANRKARPVAAAARAMLDLLPQHGLQHNPVFFHNFCQAGCLTYHHVQQQLAASARTLDVKGCIFDSAPSPASPKMIFESLPDVMGWTLGTALSALVIGYGYPRRSFFQLQARLAGHEFNIPVLSWTTIREEDSRYPQLFLYSKTDRVSPSQDIEDFIEKRRSLGVPVMIRYWENTGHVSHFREQAEEYVATVYSFLDLCLSKDECITGRGYEPHYSIEEAEQQIQRNVSV